MVSQDNKLWLQFWRDQRVDFHQPLVNPLLAKFWPLLKLTLGCRIFVPLCGKSTDMLWLAEQGHHVIGVELSPIAVRAFFAENHLKASQKQLGAFTLWKHRKISILCGDYFALTPALLGPIDTVYDRAALTALPEQIRRHYVAHLSLLMPKTIKVFLLTTEDADSQDTPEQAFGVADEIKSLYAQRFDIDLTHVESVYTIHPRLPKQPAERTEYKLYQLSTKLAVA